MSLPSDKVTTEQQLTLTCDDCIDDDVAVQQSAEKQHQRQSQRQHYRKHQHQHQHQQQQQQQQHQQCMFNSNMNADKRPQKTENDLSLKIKYKRSESRNKKTQSLFELFFEMVGEKGQRTREMGTLILLGTMFLFFIISLTGFFVMWFTEYYNNIFLSNLVLSRNSETAEKWMNPNSKYDTFLKVHIFNYTNIKDYLEGKAEKIEIKDLGPLTYKEHTTKVNVVFNDNYTVTFRDHRNYEFLPDKSSYGEHEKIFVPNVPLLAADFLIDQMRGLKKMTASVAIKAIGGNAFKTLTPSQYLWGYRDKISSLNFASGKSHFGLLMNRNGTSLDSLQINTGEDDLRKFGLVTQFNGMPLLDFWSEEQCNRIDGSDPSMFPPHLIENRSTLNVFLQVLCRKIPLKFEKQVTIFNNIEALRYRTPMNVFSHPSENSENECYCRNTQKCLPSGIINATKCYDNIPIYPSSPHFFAADPDIYKHLDGIEPRQELHQTFADIHPRFGFPINGASRIQINIAVHKGSIVEQQLRRLRRDTILPLIWIEITTGDFTEDVIDTLYASTYGLNLIQCSLKYGTLLMCLIFFTLIVASFYYLAKKREIQLEKGEKILKAELKALNRIHLSSASLAQMQS
uniref:Plasma membrane glycoprotein CD36 n=1 Tax=Glossina morsitans morsitans TaxID=37546 RepID=Q2PQQ5_GLOMM|nr:scavenger receptor protein [Glossina morsitans morsitans]